MKEDEFYYHTSNPNAIFHLINALKGIGGYKVYGQWVYSYNNGPFKAISQSSFFITKNDLCNWRIYDKSKIIKNIDNGDDNGPSVA